MSAQLSSSPSPQEQCPICAKPAQASHRPFCSRRCQMLDLGKWFTEAYRAPACESENVPDPQGEEQPEA